MTTCSISALVRSSLLQRQLRQLQQPQQQQQWHRMPPVSAPTTPHEAEEMAAMRELKSKVDAITSRMEAIQDSIALLQMQLAREREKRSEIGEQIALLQERAASRSRSPHGRD